MLVRQWGKAVSSPEAAGSAPCCRQDKAPLTGRLTQRKAVVSQFRRPEVQAKLWAGLVSWEASLLGLWDLHGAFPTLSAYVLFSSITDASHTGLGATLMTSF